MPGRRAVRASLLASASLLAVALGSATAAVNDYPDGSTDPNPIVLIDNSTQLQVVTGSATQSGVISDGGGGFGLEKIGGGTLILSGANTYGGNTLLSAGTLSVGVATVGGAGAITSSAFGTGMLDMAGGTLGAAGNFTLSNDILVISGADLKVNTDAALTLDGTVFFGAAEGLSKSGSGSLVLGTALNNTGATAINAGTLQAGAGSVFSGNSDFTIASGAALDLGGFSQDIGSLAGAGIVTNSGSSDATLFVGFFGTNSNNTIFSGVILDGGTNATALEVETAGKLTLTGANTYTGGTLICDCATLQIGNGGTTGSIGGDITHNGTLIFNRSNDYTFAGDIIQGGGTPGIVIQNGGGVLTLSGNNSYAGGTTINAGTILISADANLGDADGVLTLDGGTLKTAAGTFSSTFDLDEDRNVVLGSSGGAFNIDGGDLVIEGNISGAGALAVTGADGILELYGLNSYQGGTTVTGGAILITEVDDNFGLSTAGITLDNGSLWFFDDVTVGASRTVTLGSGGGTILIDAPASEIAGTITGSGSLTVAVNATYFIGGGNLYLTGINDYTGGTFLLGDAGFGVPATVVITDDRNLGALDGDISIDTGGIVFDASMTLNAGRSITVSGGGALFDVDSNTVTLAGVISGAGDMSKDGSGTLILTGANTKTGLLDIVDGTVQIGNGGTTGALAVTSVTSTGTLSFNRSNTLVFSADITDFCGCFGGIVTQIGSGTTILTGTNTYTGGTTISAGTLQIGNGGTAGSIEGDVVDNGTLAFNRSDDITFAGAISGSGRVTKAGAGVLTVTAANTYGGGTTISAGAVALSGSGTLGSGAISLSGALRTANTRTTANAITFNAGADERISAAAGATFNLTGNLTFSTNASDGRTVYIGSGSDTGVVTVSATTVTVGSNAGPLEIVGGTLRDISTTSPQSNFATALGQLSSVTIDAGARLEINSNGNGRTSSTETYIKLFGSGQLAMGGSSFPRVVLGNSNFAGQTSGNGYIGIGGAGAINTTVILTGDNNSAVEFQIAPGSILQIGNNGTTGSLSNGSKVVGFPTSFGNPTFRFARSDNTTIGSALVGNFLLQQAGSGILTVSANNTNGSTVAFTGSVTVSSGGLSISADNNLNGRPITLSNATVLYTTASGTFTSTLKIEGSAAVNVASGTSALWSGEFQNGNSAGALQVTGSGTLILSAEASYSGGTVIDSGGTLQVGSGGTTGLIKGNVTDNGVLAFNRSNDIAFGGAISGTGSLSKGGAGKLTLSGSNNFSGGITITAGTVSFASSGASGTGPITTTGSTIDYANGISLANSIVVNSNATQLQVLTGVIATQAGVISQTGGARPLEKIGAGTLIFTGANTYTGITNITGGTLQLGNGGAAGSIAGNVADNGALVFNRSDDVTFAGIVSGSGTLTQAGSGTTILTGANSYAGNTIVTAGILRLGSGGSLGSGGLVINGGQFDLNGSSITLPSLSGTGGTFNLGAGTVTVNAGGALAADIIGAGSLVKAGNGTLALSGNNTFSGGITIAGGTVSFATSGSTGTGPITTTGSVIDYASGITLNVPININSNTTQLQVLTGTATQAGVISETAGPRPLEKIGGGTLRLTGNNSYTGATTITAGTLQIGNGGTTGSITGTFTIANNATLAFNLSDTVIFSGLINGNGGVSQNGTGVLILTGNLAYSGPTNVNAGTLRANPNGALGFNLSSAVTVAAGAVLDVNGRTSAAQVPSLSGAGTVSNSGAVSTLFRVGSGGASSSFFGVIENGVGGISLEKVGAGTLTLVGENTYTGVTTISAGTLQIGTFAVNGGSIAGDIVNNAALTFNRQSFLNYGGVISGSGTVTLMANSDSVILTGANTYTGGTTISGGTLELGNGGTSGSIAGNVVNNSALLFNRSDAVSFGGVISGSGTVFLNGTGTITLTATNTYSGATTIGAGALMVQGSIGSSSVTVRGSTTLGGTGTVGATTVQSAGALSPGNNGIGTLTVNGNLTLDSGASMGVEVSPTSADLVTVNGNATLSGSLFANFQSGVTYTKVQTSYTLISATGTRSGTFSSFNTLGLPTGFRADITYGASNVVLLLSPNDYIWSATAGTSDWNTGSNWVYGFVPNSTQTAEFAASLRTSVTIGANTTIRAIQLDSGAPAYNFTATAGRLTITDGITQLTGNNATFTASGTGSINFGSTGNAAGSILVADGGTILFSGSADAGTGAQLVARNSGTIDFLPTNGPANSRSVAAGSIAGDAASTIRMAGNRLTVGALNSSTEFAGTLVGQGGLTKVGSGTLILSGDSSYSGGTTISAGTLQLGNGSTTGSIALNIVNNANLAFNRSNAMTYAFVISGTGAVTKAGAGVLTFTGPNTYTGGTTISAGTLEIGNGGTTGSITGNVVNNAVLAFNRSDSVTFDGTISGTGAVTKSGGASLILTAANTYSGGTTINAGTLQLGSGGTTGSIAGNVVNNGILAFNRSNDLLIAGSISGSGSVQQNGAGVTTLSGASTYIGATTINAGTLVVNGSIASNVALAGGALKGTGSIGSLTTTAGSTVGPGNSIGTVSVTSITFVAGSTYEAEANAAGQSDLINASGTASLNGTVQVLAASGTYAPVTTYRLINATGGITGTFASVTSNQAGLIPSLTYSANAVDLRLTRNDVQFGADYGVTPNQIAVGGGVTASGATSALYNVVAGAYAPATIGALLDGMSGEIHTSLRSAMLENSRLIRGAVLGRLSATSTGVWVQGFAESGDLESDGNSAEANRNQSGFIAGIDTMLGDGFRLGLAGAYGGNSVSASARSSRASGTSGAIIVYASWRSGPVALSLGGDIGWGDTSIIRSIAVLNETASSMRNTESGEIFAQASYDLDLHGVSLAPYFGLAHVTAETGAFAETGGLTALSGNGASFSQTYSMLGLRTRSPSFDLSGMAFTPRFGIGWSHAFETVTPAEIFTFRGTGQSFTVSGAAIGADTAMVELGFDLALSPQALFSLGYDGNFSGRSRSHAVRGGLDWRF